MLVTRVSITFSFSSCKTFNPIHQLRNAPEPNGRIPEWVTDLSSNGHLAKTNRRFNCRGFFTDGCRNRRSCDAKLTVFLTLKGWCHRSPGFPTQEGTPGITPKTSIHPEGVPLSIRCPAGLTGIRLRLRNRGIYFAGRVTILMFLPG